MNHLRPFYENENQREAVRGFLIECLKEMAVERVMKREETGDIADAKEAIEEAFIKLKELYGEAPKPSHPSSR